MELDNECAAITTPFIAYDHHTYYFFGLLSLSVSMFFLVFMSKYSDEFKDNVVCVFKLFKCPAHCEIICPLLYSGLFLQ